MDGHPLRTGRHVPGDSGWRAIRPRGREEVGVQGPFPEDVLLRKGENSPPAP